MRATEQEEEEERGLLLRSDETRLVGRWLSEGKRVVGDGACTRIEYLVAHVLTRLAYSPTAGAWETLFRDPADGRLWERTYPSSYQHGGGPPSLRVISETEAREKYGLVE